MEIQEIKCAGNSFTWIRPNGYVKSRLDRFLVSENWLSLWPESCQLVLQRNLSNHCPTILQTSMVDWGPKPFRVFDWWLQQKGYQKMVREAWINDQQGGWRGIVLKNKLKNLKAVLKQWSKVEGNINAKKILNIQQKLNEVENLASHQNLSDQELVDRKALQQDLWNASNAFESLMRQKSRARWLKEGDYNTAYFHKLINFWRAYNVIPGILIDGEWVQQPNTVKNEAANFFQNRFTEQLHSRPTLDGVHFKSISQGQREQLTALFSDQEIKEAMWGCGGDKCLGLDGLNFNFIKQFWDVLNPDFRRFVDEFYAHGSFPRGSNASFVALIPKMNHPQSLNDYRPISLIGCMYKMIVKLLSNRLRSVMDDLIDERQSAFIKGRHILHGILILNEVVEEAMRSKKPAMIFKVDFEKAYDFVSWSFLDYMLLRLGFCQKWRKWISACL